MQHLSQAKEKYRGVFEIQKSGDKTSSGEIGLNMRTHVSPKVGQDQVSGGVSVLCWHAATVAYVANAPRKPLNSEKSTSVGHLIGEESGKLVSTIRAHASPPKKGDGTRCPEW